MAYTNIQRILGLNSGIDTEQFITNMMKAESLKLNKLQRNATLTSWRQEQYRNVYSDLRTFQSTFLNLTKAGSIRTEATFKKQNVSVTTSAGQDSTAVSVGSGAAVGRYSVIVEQLAAADMYESASKIGGDIGSADGFKFDVKKIRDGANYDVTLDGVTKKISFDADDVARLTDEQSFIDALNEKLKSAFGVEGTNGPQKVEAKLTQSGGISIFTNRYHSDFKIADGSYNFSDVTAAEESGFENGNAKAARDLELFIKIGDETAKVTVAVTQGMTQQQVADGINKQLEDNGLSDKVWFSVDGNKNFKITNFSSAKTLEIGDYSGAQGSMEFLGFGDELTEQKTDTDGNTYYEYKRLEISPAGSLIDLGITSGAAAKFSTDATLSEIFGSDLTKETSFTINGKRFVFNGSTKLSDLMDQVNSAELGVTMSYNDYSGTFQLESGSMGFANQISMSGELLTDNLEFGTTAKRAAADSVVTINGVTLTRSTNEIEYLGVNWTLNKTTSGEELAVTVTRDADSIVESIKEFVDGYNSLIEKLGNLANTSRPKYKGSYYDPLIDEEKAEMTEKEIEKWEEEAKKGLLYRDSILTGITRDLRSALNQSVTLEDGSKISLYSLGITTSSDWTKGGQLEIDEDKLRKAIETHGDNIMTLFTKSSAEGGKGLAERVNDVVNSAVSINGSISNRAGLAGTATEYNNILYNQLKNQNDKIERMMEMLAEKETKYYNMFARMETAMAKANNQMQYVTSMLGGSV